MADQDDEPRRLSAQTEDRTVLGGAPVAGGPTMASTGAFDTVGGGDLGGPGSRDPGDATSDLRDPVESGQGRDSAGARNEQQDALRGQGRAQGRKDGSDAESLLDDTRAQADPGGADNNDNL